MEFSHNDGKLEVQYDERLVKLIREIRQFQGMGYAVPAKIQKTGANAMKFYRQAIILKQVRNFHAYRRVEHRTFFSIVITYNYN